MTPQEVKQRHLLHAKRKEREIAYAIRRTGIHLTNALSGPIDQSHVCSLLRVAKHLDNEFLRISEAVDRLEDELERPD